MSVEAYSRAWSSRVGDPYRKLVLLAYADYAHRNGRNSCPSKKTVAQYAECDKRTVQRHTDALLEDGFIRLGDQSSVEHIRADRRPKVYDLAMDDATRLEWKAAAARGDTETPRPDEDLEDLDPERGDTESPRPRSALSPRDDVDGVTETGPRGDTAVSPNPSTNPSPPTPNGSTGCAAHPTQPHASCRTCGTSTRSQTTAAAADARRRAREIQDFEVQAERRARGKAPSTSTPHGKQLVAAARAELRSGLKRTKGQG